MLDTIEEEVIPLYYARGPQGYSPEWVRRCRRAIITAKTKPKTTINPATTAISIKA